LLTLRGASGVQRKIFRVEEMAGGGRVADAEEQPDRSPTDNANDSHHQLETEWMAHELSALNSAIMRNMRELAALLNDGNDRRMARAAGELGAAVEGMEKATQKILASAEVVDDCARALAAAFSNDYHHGLAQDVQDHVVRIYEACNFQDLAGQRIGKVIALLIMIEEKLGAMIARNSGTGAQLTETRPAHGTDLINGPRLDGAAGHASQRDIDAMFA
jgi:chemotaxis protein CheZ